MTRCFSTIRAVSAVSGAVLLVTTLLSGCAALSQDAAPATTPVRVVPTTVPVVQAQNNVLITTDHAVNPVSNRAPQDAQLTPTSTATEASVPVTMITLWWPAPLYPVAHSSDPNNAVEVFNDQIDQFENATKLSVNVRIKRGEGVGGIYETLYSGETVAAAAMPDLTLMQRDDLYRAVTNKLIHPIDTATMPINDLFKAGIELGQLQNTQYGLPYVLELQHMAYHTAAFPQAPHTLNDLLTGGQPFLFPAAGNGKVNAVFLAQYLAEGGHIADKDGAPTLDRDPLVLLLTYYEQATQSGSVGPHLLAYNSPAQYWGAFNAAKTGVAVIDSTTFLAQHIASANPVTSTAIPLLSLSGNAVPVVDSWLWVITTNDPVRQTNALRLMAWLLDAHRQRRFTLAMGALPSRRSALIPTSQATPDANASSDPFRAQYADFAAPLLDAAFTPPADSVKQSVATALQNAFEDVLNGRKSAAAAADEAFTMIGKTN